MDFSITAPVHGNDDVDGPNATNKHYLKEQMELLGELATNDASKIGMLPSVSKNISINFPEQYFQIIIDNYRLNGLKGSTRTQNKESLFKYQQYFYNAQMKDDVKHRGVKFQWNNKLFLSLNLINGKNIHAESRVF